MFAARLQGDATWHSTSQGVGGEGGIRTHGTVTRTTVFEFYDSHVGPCRAVAKRVLGFGNSEATMPACAVRYRAVLRGWFAIWFAGPIPSAEPRGRPHGRFSSSQFDLRIGLKWS